MEGEMKKEKMVLGRRGFIKSVLGLFAVLGALWSPLSSLVQRAMAQTKRIVLPKGTKRESLVQKNPATLDTRNLELTPLKDFDTMGIDDLRVDMKTWQLEVEGHVDRPLRISYEDILAMPSLERKVLMICPGFFANHGQWKGVSIGALLTKAGADRDITHVTVEGPRGDYTKTERFSIADVLSGKVFLAYQVNGQTLPVRNGYPLRVVAEDYYGDDWVKYVFRVTAHKIGKDKVSTIDMP